MEGATQDEEGSGELPQQKQGVWLCGVNLFSAPPYHSYVSDESPNYI